MSVQLPRGTVRFRAERRYRGIELALYVEEPGGTLAVVQSLELKQLEQGDWFEGFLSLPEETLQGLMDDLWHCGLRPSAGVASAGQLEALQAHLQDMRAIASHGLNITLEKP